MSGPVLDVVKPMQCLKTKWATLQQQQIKKTMTW